VKTSATSAGRPISGAFPIIAAAAVTLVGVIVLMGWLLEIDWVTTTRAREVMIKPNSALAFILSGAALFFLQSSSQAIRRAALPCAIVVGVIAVLNLGEHATGSDFGISDFLLQAHPRSAWAQSATIAPAAAVSFVFAAWALGWMSRSKWNEHPTLAPSYLGLLISVSGLVASIGYPAGINAWKVWWNPTSMPTYSALAFVVLGTALFAHAWRKTNCRWQISGWLTAGFIAGLALLVGVAADSYRSTNTLVDASSRVRSTLEVVAQIHRLDRLIETEEDHLRAYLITGNEDMLHAYNRVFPQIRSAIQRIRNDIKENDLQQTRITAVEDQIAIRNALFQQALDERRNRGSNEFNWQSAMGRTKALGNHLSASLNKILDDAERFLSTQEQDMALAAARTFSVLPIGVLLSVLMLTLGFLRLNAEVIARRHEADLRRQNEERLRLALAAAKMGTWDVDLTSPDPAKQSVKYSDQTGLIVGHQPEHSHSSMEYWTRQIHPDDRIRVMDSFKAAVDGESLYSADFRLVQDNGAKVQWLSSRGAVLRDDEGKPVRALGVIMDVTERKKADEAMQEKDLQMRLVIHGGDIGLWDWNVSTGRLVVNERWFTMLGMDPKSDKPTIELWNSLVHPDDLPKLDRLVADVILPKTGRNFETEIRARHRDGHYIWILDRGAVVSRAPDGSPLRVAGTHIEITARKQAEEKIQRLNADLEQRVAESTRELRETNAALINFKAALDEHAIVAITDAHGRITYANDNFCTISQYSRDELIGQDHRLINSGYHSKAFIRDLWETITSGRVWKGEIRNRAKDGSFYWVNTTIVPFIGKGGKPTHYIAIRNDITPRIQAEENIRQLNADLQNRALKLEAANRELEAFSYSVSHDLRAPLRAVDGFSRMLFEDYASCLDSEGQRMVKVIRREAQRMGQLIDDLLAFSHVSRQQTDPVQIDMRAMAQDVFNELIAREPNRSLRFELESLPPAIGTRAMIRQVWTNLIGNAIKFTRKRVLGVIEIGSKTDETGASIYFIKDNGAGFDMRYTEKLFGVFQRLHAQPEFEGTGVGLALVKRIVERHGGRVWAESAVDQGAQFFFTLPPEKK